MKGLTDLHKLKFLTVMFGKFTIKKTELIKVRFPKFNNYKSFYPFKNSSTFFAQSLPSAMAQTTRLCPFLASPQEKYLV